MRTCFSCQNLIFLFLFSLCFTVNAFANEVWKIGTDDNKFDEFAAARDHDKFTKLFPNDPSVQIGCLNCQMEWPYIHPGPSDLWAGRKNHTFTVKFDLPPFVDDGTKEKIQPPAYELLLKGWGHYGGPPTLSVNLNGKTKEIATEPNARSDKNLTDPKTSKPGIYRLLFPASTVQEKGNILTITNQNGSWFIYDSLAFNSKTGKVEAINLTPVRGIFKADAMKLSRTDSDGKTGIQASPIKAPARKVKIDFQGEVLAGSYQLNLNTYSQGKNENDKDTLISSQTLSRKISDSEKEDAQSEIEMLIPLTEENCDKPLKVQATLEVGGRKIEAEPLQLPAERKWDIHLIHQTHLDIGYTHTQVDVLERQVQSLRDALKYIEETKDYPVEARFKYHPEGMWAIEEFFKRATEDEKKAFIQAAKNRDIHLDILYAQAMTGMYCDEELFELMGSAIRFGREHGIVIDSAMQTDVPGYTWGLVPVLAKCGVRYMTMGPNGGHRVGRLYYWGEKPFWWVSPSGKEKVLCYLLDTGYHQFHRKQMGHRMTADELFTILDGKDWLGHSETPRTYPLDLVPIRYGIEGDNGRPNRVISDVVKEWNETYYYPKLTLSRNSDFMVELEKRFGDQLPVIRGDYTPYWEDGAVSTSEATSINRRAKNELLWAELGFARHKPEAFAEHIAAFDQAWTDLIMYDEHTWGAHNSISEPDSAFVKQQDDYKQAYARRGFEEAKTLVKESAIAPSHETQTFFSKAHTTHPQAEQNAETTSKAGEAKANAEQGTLENDHISLKIDKKTGAIISFKMKGIENDLVNPADDGNAGLNDYLYIIGRDATKNRERYDQGVKISVYEPQDQKKAQLLVESEVPNCNSLKRIITIFDNEEIVHITNIMDKKMERRQEGTFFGFPFNVPNGIWRIDTPWAMVQVEKDQLPGANRNYYCVQRFCNISNDKFGIDWVTVDAPMVQFSPILFTPAWSRTWKEWRESIEPNGTIYSWVCNNHWETNYKAGQEGEMRFTYIIRPYVGKYDAARSQRFARGTLNFDITSSLVKCDNPEVLTTRIKPCRTEKERSISAYGQGLFVRLYNPTDKPQKVSLTFYRPNSQEVYDAQLFFSNPWEDRVELISKTLTIDPYDFVSVRAE